MISLSYVMNFLKNKLYSLAFLCAALKLYDWQVCCIMYKYIYGIWKRT